jgi:hypothetical protein
MSFWKVYYRDEFFGECYRFRFPLMAWIIGEIGYRIWLAKVKLKRALRA